MQDLIDRLAPYAPLLALLGIVLGAVGVWGMTRRKDKMMESKTPSGWTAGPTDEERAVGYEQMRNAEPMPERYSDLPTLGEAVEAARGEDRVYRVVWLDQGRPDDLIQCQLAVVEGGHWVFHDDGPIFSVNLAAVEMVQYEGAESDGPTACTPIPCPPMQDTRLQVEKCPVTGKAAYASFDGVFDCCGGVGMKHATALMGASDA